MGENVLLKQEVPNKPNATPDTTDASHRLSADATNDMGFGTKALRVGQVTLEGAAYAIPGAINAVKHDLDPANWQETGVKVLSAGVLGVALRVALPESGAIKAIAGTAMALYFAKDAAIPVFDAWKNVATNSSGDVMDKSAQTMGNGLGQFAVDGYLTSKIAGYTGRMTPVMGERFAPKQWGALETWKTDHLGTSSTIGVGLNTFIGKVDGTMKSFGDKLNPPKPEVANMPPGELLKTLVSSDAEHGRHDYSDKIYSQGITGSDGRAHGLDGTVELLLSGQRPSEVPGVNSIMTAAGAEATSTAGAMGQLKGWTEQRGIFVPDYVAEKAPGTATPEIIVPAGDAAAIKSGHTDSTGGGGKKVFTTAEVMTAENMGKLAGVIKAEIGSVSDVASAVRDGVGRTTSVVHTTTEQNFKPLDPGYLLARNSMIDLANQVGDNPRNFMQVDGLFKRLADTTSQAHNSNNGADGQHVGRMNVYAAENQTTYVRNMIQAGIDPKEALAQKPLPALVQLVDDQMVVGRDPKTGKVVTSHQGPHTVRAIFGPNGEPVWPIDTVTNPIRDLGTRAYLTSGIYGHEYMHNQYGQMGKLDPLIRDAKLTAAAEKALGADANKMIDIPKPAPVEPTADGQPAAPPVESDMPPLPDKMAMKDIMVNVAKAWADETFADWGAASESGQSAAPYFQALRKNGQLYNGTVISEEMRAPDNPLGVEAHPVDKVRPLIQAALIRKMAVNPDGTADPALMAHAQALENYSRDASKPGDIVLASEDAPGQSITIPIEAFKKFLPELVNLQVDTPLPRLQGHTLFEILPDLRKNYAKIENVSNQWTDAINNGKGPETLPFDINSTKMTHVYGAGQPAMLKLIAGGMDPMQAKVKVTEFSDFFGNKFLGGDPHVDPVQTPLLKQLQLAPGATIARMPEMAANQFGKAIAQQYQVRDWLGRNSLPVSGAGGSLVIQDLMGLQKKKEEILNTGH